MWTVLKTFDMTLHSTQSKLNWFSQRNIARCIERLITNIEHISNNISFDFVSTLCVCAKDI